MAAYDNVALPGAPNIATAGNYAQMLFNMGQSLGESYQKGQTFQYEQRQRNLFQSPDNQALLQEAMQTGDYSKLLAPIATAGGSQAVQQMIPLIKYQQLVDAYRARATQPWPDENNLSGAPGAARPPSAPLPAATHATGPGGITGRAPGAGPIGYEMPDDIGGGESADALIARLAKGRDLDPEALQSARDTARQMFGDPTQPLTTAQGGALLRAINPILGAGGMPAGAESGGTRGYGGPPGAAPTAASSASAIGTRPPITPDGGGADASRGGMGVSVAPPAPGTRAPGTISDAGAPVVGTAPGRALTPEALRESGARRVAGGLVPGATVPSGPPLTDAQQQQKIDNLRRAGTQLLRQSSPIMPGEPADPAGMERAKRYFDQANELEKELIDRRKLSEDAKEAGRLGLTLPQYQAQKAATEAAGKLRGEEFGRQATALEAKSTAADTMRGHLQVMNAALESPDLFTGPGHEFVTNYRKFMQNYAPPKVIQALKGTPFEITTTTTPMEAMGKVTAANVLNQMNSMRDEASQIGGSGGQLRIAQMDLMIKAAQNLDMSIPALRLLTELGHRGVVYDKAIGQMARDYIQRSPTHTLDEGFQQKLSDFYEKHPLLSPQEEANINYLSAPTVPSRVKNEADARKWMAQMHIEPGSVARTDRTTLNNFNAAEKAGRRFQAEYIDLPR